ncbi:hypothetical protein SH584_00580 [Sphingomonas sp. LY29]|uniref:hypothetical protein n=1 Tax=Sphingomonas sp. LY29 TaxID=3095341 RepID=UPI002D77ECF1|nr:hypothetical protein [Sphingomonas sp. LY29]WRP25983.1 hypothetical protein SH584_00580 [Sphingomonas sp. LY29]
MSDPSPEAARRRRRWISLGETIAIAALAISALGLWNSWRGDQAEKPVVAIEKTKRIPLALRGQVQDEGQALVLSPVEAGHALDSATLTADGRSVSIGSDGRIAAADVETLLGEVKEKKDGVLTVAIASRYVEAGDDRRANGRYRLAYRWVGGGLFDDRDLRIVGLSRA